jgi:hypothetical protein
VAIAYNTSVVRNGLVLHLDAANTKSYPGSGIAWTDLSGNGKSGTLTNGPTYTTDSNGGIVFDQINDYASIANSYISPSLPTGSSSRTLIACFKTASTLSYSPYQHIIHYGSQVVDQAYGITLFWNGNFYISNHTWSGTTYMSDYAVLPNTVYWVSVSYNNSSTPRNTFFVNGKVGNVAFGQGKSADYAINTGTGFQLNIGTRIGPAEYFGGTVYMCMVYNRDLSIQEIRQNFEATRGRYGI